jgi:hypothetical protein
VRPRFTIVHQLTAILIALALGGASASRTETRAHSPELTFSAAKDDTQYMLFLPEGRGKAPLAGGGFKPTLVPVFSETIRAHMPRPAPALADFTAKPVSAHPARTLLVGTVELRI